MRLLIVTLLFLTACGKDGPAVAQTLEAPVVVTCALVDTQTVTKCNAFGQSCSDVTQNEYACDVVSEAEEKTCAVFENGESEKLFKNSCAYPGFGGSPIKWPEHKPEPTQSSP